MDENKEKVHIDYSGLIQQMADKVVADFMTSLAPDEETRRVMAGLFAIHRKYGIDAATTLKIVMDLAELMNNKED